MVVWEWVNDLGQWAPYSPAVCGYLETQLAAGATSTPLAPTHDQMVQCYDVDFQLMKQIRRNTGETIDKTTQQKQNQEKHR